MSYRFVSLCNLADPSGFARLKDDLETIPGGIGIGVLHGRKPAGNYNGLMIARLSGRGEIELERYTVYEARLNFGK